MADRGCGLGRIGLSCSLSVDRTRIAELDTSFPDLPFMTIAPGLEAAFSCILLAGLDRSGVRTLGCVPLIFLLRLR